MTFKADRLAPEVFRTMLQRGRGSALMHVLAYGLDGVEDIVLQACLCNQVYDPQCEDPRAPWLYRMFKDTQQYARFSAAIVATLPLATEDYDQDQLCGLAALMGAHGDTSAASALRGFVLGREFSDDHVPRGCDALVRLDGIPALAELGRRFGIMLLADPDRYVPMPDSLMDGFGDQPGNLALLEQLVGNNIALATYVAGYRQELANGAPPLTQEEHWVAQRERVRKQYPIGAILAAAAAGEGMFPSRYSSFGRHATAEELETVLTQLLGTDEPRASQRLLWIFRKTSMPRIDARIWALAQHDDEELRDAALCALSNIRDPEVGQFGRRMLQEHGLDATDASVLGLFIHHFREGDAALILKHLDGLALSDDEAHAFSYRVIDICEANDSPSIASLAEWAYKSNPCSVCRKHAVERLLAVASLPSEFAEECAFDADQDIQRLSQQ